MVDGEKARIILAALVTPSEVMENQPVLDLLWRVRFRWKLWPRQFTESRARKPCAGYFGHLFIKWETCASTTSLVSHIAITKKMHLPENESYATLLMPVMVHREFVPFFLLLGFLRRVLATSHICSKKERSCWLYPFFFLAIYSSDR